MASDDKKPFLLRIPPGLWTDVEKWAADELRSVNGQKNGVPHQEMACRRRADTHVSRSGRLRRLR